MGARGGGVTPTPSSSAALVLPLPLLPLLPLVSLLDRLLVASLISTSTAVSPCVCPCERASERVSERGSSAPPRRAAPAALLSMCSGAHPVLNNSGHVNSVSPAARAAGARPGAAGSPPPGTGIPGLCCWRPCRAVPQNSCSVCPSHSWGPQMVPLPGHTGKSLHPESSAHSATFGPRPGRGRPTPPSSSWPP